MSDTYSRDGQPESGSGPGQPPEEDAMAAEHEASLGATARYGVSDELRMRRESMGKSIADVVDAVRIQTRYLEALEDGRHDDLPGTVYALGFVRTYAEYLGLDGSELVARYKEETEGIKTQSYAMPEPLEEGKVPTAAILLVAVLLAAAAYGAWFFLAQQDGRVTQEVPEVPARLSAVTEAPATGVAPVVPAPEETVETVSAPEAVPAPLAATEGDAPPPPAVAVVPSAAAPAHPPVQPAAVVPVRTDVALPSEPAQGAAAPVVPESPPAEAAAGEAAVTQPPQAPESDTPAMVVAETPSATPLSEEPREPRVYGLGNLGARIVIVAEEDAWLEVTDTDNARLFSRVLRKGDSYRAPSREGAKFVTGNAGGLKVVVDGEVAPALGPPGQVRRDVKLDPDLLKAGRAWP